ncbi:auxin-responsive protein IAA11-like isoform X2 [Gastrolobium bilobum]|uniref:auxin-responsive protein IAA11-like isoform X2 n=1 Tax=Gastrolobium bilobum TaxID=150636 RepID=UPI002AB0AF72|nr:auxin-responsive protein IAA11-like isoform X2 [Gastrolobium bilobum]
MQGFSNCGSMSTLSKDDNLVLSSEDSSSPDESHLELGLALSLSPYATKVFPSSSNVTSGTNTPPDSVVPSNGLSQVVGWPPLGIYRMNSYNSHAKSPATEVFNSVVEENKSNKSADNGNDNKKIISKENGNLRSSLFVKVNMDGIPIGRKVDLSAHSSYKTLARTLEDMFNEPTTVLTCKGSNGENHGIVVGVDGQSRLLDGSSNFVLTYKDKEGDWMLVGDVPWWMFLSSVRRLRIMRTSEANGLAPRLEEKNSRLKSKPI